MRFFATSRLKCRRGQYLNTKGQEMAVNPRRIGLLLMLGVLLVGFQVEAEDFRCGMKIITRGERSYDVLKKCGEPTNVTTWEEVRTKKEFGAGALDPDPGIRRVPLRVEELVTIEEWEYDLGPNSFIRYLRFENGRLIRITEGDYGGY
jgi:hypothetical protein